MRTSVFALMLLLCAGCSNESGYSGYYNTHNGSLNATKTIIGVLLIIGAFHVYKTLFINKVNAGLSSLVFPEGVKITKITPFEYITAIRTSYTEGSVEHGYVTFRQRMDETYECSEGWRFEVTNTGKAPWVRVSLLLGEYDRHGRVAEGEYQDAVIQNLRPGEKQATYINFENANRIMLEKIKLTGKLTDAKPMEHSAEIKIDLPKPYHLNISCWPLALIMAYLFFKEIRSFNNYGTFLFGMIFSLLLAHVGFFKKASFSLLALILLILAFCVDAYPVCLAGAVYLGIVWTKRISLAEFYKKFY